MLTLNETLIPPAVDGSVTPGPSSDDHRNGDREPTGDAGIEPRVVDHGPIGAAEIERMAWDLERAGLGGRDDVAARSIARSIARLVDRARPAGVSPVLIDVLADAAAPEPARIRAFGRVAVELAARRAAA